MSQDPHELRRIHWTSAIPAVRLLSTTSRALDARRMILAFWAILGIYVVGRLLDAAWLAAGGGVAVMPSPSGALNELNVFCRAGVHQQDWLAAQRDIVRQRIAEATAGSAEDAKAANPSSVRDALRTLTDRKERQAALELVDGRLAAQLSAIRADAQRSAAQRQDAIAEQRAAADSLRFTLYRASRSEFGLPDTATALSTLLSSSAASQPSESDLTLLREALEREQRAAELEQYRPGGVFSAVIDHLSHCLTAGVTGLLAGRIGPGGGAYDAQPSLLGSAGSGLATLGWLALHRPAYGVLFLLTVVAILSLTGMAICRSAAVQIARGQTMPIAQSPLAFSREKFVDAASAWLLPVLGFAGVWLLLALGGLLGAVPGIGPVVTGLLYGLALLGGLALALFLVTMVLGLHLMWPTIAVEGSDVFDAAQHGLSYVTQRFASTVFYYLVLLSYGALSYLVLRAILVLSLKLTHSFSDAGLSWFGLWSSAQSETLSRVQAMWRMPDWQSLPLLPSIDGPPLYGVFFAAPLSGTEWLASVLISLWVFLLVGLLCAWVLSFYFCGSTQAYLLLRHDIDGIDYDEIFYETEQDEPAAAAVVPVMPSESGVVSLPVMSKPRPGGEPA